MWREESRKFGRTVVLGNKMWSVRVRTGCMRPSAVSSGSWEIRHGLWRYGLAVSGQMQCPVVIRNKIGSVRVRNGCVLPSAVSSCSWEVRHGLWLYGLAVPGQTQCPVVIRNKIRSVRVGNGCVLPSAVSSGGIQRARQWNCGLLGEATNWATIDFLTTPV
jgi:hypothetical protein